MKFTLSWLKDYLETDASLEEIEFALTDLGLEVEGVEDPIAIYEPFVIGRVLHAEPHPDADKLRLCQVDIGGAEPSQIICGAPNAREGITVVVAQPNTYIPGLDITISVGKIRGVESFGMMCSRKELLLGDDHDGIIELDGDAEIGMPFSKYLAVNEPAKIDPVIEIAITPNRPDALGIYGIARDLAARGLGKLSPMPKADIKGGFKSPIDVSIDDEARVAAPHFTGRYIRGVKNGASPQWLQDRLRAIGLRPISILVDITNYFTFAFNRPLHVFDADKVKGNLRVSLANGGETLMGLDDKDYTFSADMTMISDDENVESIAGIMGGAPTGCELDTVNVFLESAYWNPIATAITGRKLKINTDARYRFERGIDPEFTRDGLDLAAEMIVELCGGEVSEMVEAGAVIDWRREYRFDPERVAKLVGMEISKARQVEILDSLGFEVNDATVTPPSWRPDVQNDADIVEEVVRVQSLTSLEGKPMSRETTGIIKPVLTEKQVREANIRHAIADAGYNECVTYSFIDETSALAFGSVGDVVLSNPISSEMSHMRPSLYPSLLQAASRNIARGFSDLKLFEIGNNFHGLAPEAQVRVASGILTGLYAPRNPYGDNRAVDVFDAKTVIAASLAEIGIDIEKLTMIEHDAPWFHPARAAKLGLGPKKIIAEFGEFHPSVLKQLGLKSRAVGFSIFLDEIPASKKKSATKSPLKMHDLQKVDRDFAFVVDKDVPAKDLVKAVMGADKTLIESVNLFDVFEGKKAEEQLGEGKKSLALSVVLQPNRATLTEEDLTKLSQQIVEKAEKATGAILRA